MGYGHDEQKPSEAELEAPSPAAGQEEGEPSAVADAPFGIEVSCAPDGLCLEVTDYHVTRTHLSWERVKELLAAARESGYTD